MGKYEDVEQQYRQRLAMVEADLDTAMALLRLAQTDLNLGQPSRLGEMLTKARAAQQDAEKFLTEVKDPETRQRLHYKQQAVVENIGDVERRRVRQEAQCE